MAVSPRVAAVAALLSQYPARLLLLAFLLFRWLTSRAIKPRTPLKKAENGKLKFGNMDPRRQACVCFKKAQDHAQDVVVVGNPHFDRHKTIFFSLTSPVEIAYMKYKIGNTIHWSDAAVHEIAELYSALPPRVPPNRKLLDFMETECDFRCEHADGSFMDHLTFVYEYIAVNYRGHSPVIGLLHSIMGVGTNIFPMEASKIPMLKAMLTPAEWIHTQMFPTVIRVINGGMLLDQLEPLSKEELAGLKGFTCNRLIDNEEVRMTGEEFWVQLNLQLVHTLDFLPVADWGSEFQFGDPFFQTFRRLYRFLEHAGKLQANVDLDLSSRDATGGKLSLGRIVSGALGFTFRRKQRKYSEAIGHDLGFIIVGAFLRPWGWGALGAAALRQPAGCPRRGSLENGASLVHRALTSPRLNFWIT
jgi:hypothetical protein